MEYKVIETNTHLSMTKALNEAAADGWQPISYAIRGTNGHHYVILARRVT